MKWIAFITFGVIMTTSNAFASGDSWDEDELAILVPIVTVAALFTFLTLRHYFENRVQRAAIEQGQPHMCMSPIARRPTYGASYPC